MRLEWFSATHVGRVRATNQDAVAADGHVFVVADGMGGHVGGEVASSVAIEAIEAAVARGARSDEALREANAAILERAREDPRLAGMGTTATLALIDRDGHVDLASVGDSRAYLLSHGELCQLTSDHTYVQELVDAGTITLEQALTHRARHVLTRVLGVMEEVEPDRFEFDLAPGDVLLLCSDGLVNEVDEETIAAILRANAPEEAVHGLVEAALAHGGSDNVSVVVVAAREGRTVGRRRSERRGTAAQPSGAGSVVGQLAGRLPRPLPTQLTARAKPGRALLRIVALLAALAVVAAGVVGVVALYNDHSYIVTLLHGRVVIEQGRLGGILWFHPRVVELTSLRARELTPGLQLQLNRGMQEGSLQAAQIFVENLRREAALQHASLTSLRFAAWGVAHA
jgi:serine/threonine protein phosphatase PrpC